MVHPTVLGSCLAGLYRTLIVNTKTLALWRLLFLRHERKEHRPSSRWVFRGMIGFFFRSSCGFHAIHGLVRCQHHFSSGIFFAMTELLWPRTTTCEARGSLPVSYLSDFGPDIDHTSLRNCGKCYTLEKLQHSPWHKRSTHRPCTYTDSPPSQHIHIFPPIHTTQHNTKHNHHLSESIVDYKVSTFGSEGVDVASVSQSVSQSPSTQEGRRRASLGAACLTQTAARRLRATQGYQMHAVGRS